MPAPTAPAAGNASPGVTRFSAVAPPGVATSAVSPPNVASRASRRWVVAFVGVLIASALVGDSDGRGGVFLADKAWFYLTLLAVGYMISRGLAKSGVRAHRAA
jgi:hypothetical protein